VAKSLIEGGIGRGRIGVSENGADLTLVPQT